MIILDVVASLALCLLLAAAIDMNKKHWNTLVLDGSLDADLVCELIDHSYSLVVASLTKKQRDTLS